MDSLTHVIFFCYVIHIHPRPVRLHKCRFAATPAHYFGSGSMRNLCAALAGKNIFNFFWPPHLIDLYSADILCVSVSLVYVKRDDRNSLTNGVQYNAAQPHSQDSRTVVFFYCSFRIVSTYAVLFYILRYIYLLFTIAFTIK